MSTVLDHPPPVQPSGAASATVESLLDDPDQTRIRDDLATFFGPRADAFLATYEKMRAKTWTQRRWPLTWSWPVFFLSFVWFFYRKMYGIGAVMIFAPFILAYLLGGVGGSFAIMFAMMAKPIYVQLALRRIIKADQQGLTGAGRSDYLRRAGGVSLAAGIFAGIIFGLFVAAVIFAAVQAIKP
jgi:hypothetical protein